MATKLFVGSLPWAVDDQQLKDLFSEFGEVSYSKVIIDRDTNRSKGFGFVEMSTDEEAARAVKELEGKDLCGRPVAVSEARPKA